MRIRSFAAQARPIQGIVILALAFLLGAVWISAAQAIETHGDHVEVEGNFDTRRDLLVWWGLSVYGPTEVGQNLIVEGVSDFQGTIFNSSKGAPLTVGDALLVKFNTTIKGMLYARGGIKNDKGKLILDDKVKITKTLNQKGSIYNSGGYVTVDDTFNVKGKTQTRRLTVRDYTRLEGEADLSGASVKLRGIENAKFTLDKDSVVGDQDVALQFSDDGVSSAHALTWDDGDGRFEFGGDSVQATTFVAGTASTTLADGSLTSTGALAVSSAGGKALTLDSDSGTLVLGAGTNTIANTDASTLTLSGTGGTVAIDPTNVFAVGGGFGTTGMTVTSAGVMSVDGLATLDGGIDVDSAFTVGNGTGNVDTTGTLDADGLASLDGGIDVDGAFSVSDTTGTVASIGDVNFADTAGGDTIDIGDAGDTVNIDGSVSLAGTTDESFTIDVGSATADQDVALYFSDDGTDTAHGLIWDDGDDRFEFGADDLQATTFVAGAASTTLADGSLTSTGAMSVNSGGGSALTLDSDSGTLLLGAGTNTIANVDASTLTLSGTGGTVAIDPTNVFAVGGGFGSTGMTVTAAGVLSVDGLSTLNGGIDVDSAFTVAGDGTGDVAGIGDVDFADGSGSDTIDIGDVGDTVNIAGSVSVSGTTDTTFTVDSDAVGTEPADGAGVVIEGGTGDVSMLWNATDDELEFTFGGGNADIQGGNGMFDSLAVTGQTTLGTTVDVNAPGVTLDADNTGGAGVDTFITFERGTTGTDGALLFDETTDDRFEFNYDVATSGSFVSPTSLIVGATTYGDGSVADTGALTVSSGGVASLSLDSADGILNMGAGTNTLGNTDATDLTIDSGSGVVAVAAADEFDIGGGFGSTGITGTAAGLLNVDGLASLDGGIDVDGLFTVTDGTGAVDINAGTIDGTVIGGTTTAAADFTDLFVEDVQGFGVTTLTVTDDGAANDALAPASSYVEIDADETADVGIPDVTLGGTPADGDLLVIVNVETDASHDTFTITDAAGVALAGTPTLGPLDSLTLIYNGTASSWIELSRSDN